MYKSFYFTYITRYLISKSFHFTYDNQINIKYIISLNKSLFLPFNMVAFFTGPACCECGDHGGQQIPGGPACLS